MKVFAAILVACLVMSVQSQSSSSSSSAATTGGISGTGLAGALRGNALGGNFMGLAAMTGQLGDNFQLLMRCQLMNINPILCMSM